MSDGHDPQVTVRIDGHVAVVSLNRPERHNAMGDRADAEFFGILDDIRCDKNVRAVIWRGEGPSFSSGRDVADLGVRAPGVTDFDVIERGHWLTRLLYDFPVPIICALKGWVLGGQFERSLLADLRIAAESAIMALPELEHGVVTDSAGVARLFQIGGPSLALDLALTGRRITAREALSLGIVSRVVSDEDLDRVAMEMAELIASRPPMAVRLVREHVKALANPEVESTLRREMVAQTLVFKTEDYQELKRARSEGREPRYSGN